MSAGNRSVLGIIDSRKLTDRLSSDHTVFAALKHFGIPCEVLDGGDYMGAVPEYIAPRALYIIAHDGAAEWLKQLLVGTVTVPGIPDAITDWIPRALILLVLAIGMVWVPLRRSRLGLSIYAIGSDSLAAFRGGIAVGRTKVVTYAIAGLFAAMGGLVLTMSTGIGAPIPGPYLLASIAAVVLGGVTLGGGRGGIVGPIVAVFILRLVRSDLTFLAVDPNVATIVEGTIMVAVVMLGALVALRSRAK